ncbi:hypothetical protein SAMN04487770_1328 [Butyrivibrio sp. ob235]|uniref:hypothetical protein n=1 Tax=Butyrivibrio sp. ob235 TaxID=1761780 RepID=UPI0008C6D7AF|nr:hypothetical protein [Butyrivibrio sp. ob235]SEM28197.1 hypothetical protein SAMN04487770_1328 [Butyrivibrio sp. ob235]
MNAIIAGLMWSVLWIGYIFVVLKWYPWELLHDYPEDIKEAATLPEPTDKQKKQAKLVCGIICLVIFGSLLAFGLTKFASAQTTFLMVLVYVFIVGMIWNAIDLLVMDWILVCSITPKIVVIEGTEGCKGYKDYMFHFKGFLIGCVYTAIMAIVFSGIIYGILKFFIW